MDLKDTTVTTTGLNELTGKNFIKLINLFNKVCPIHNKLIGEEHYKVHTKITYVLMTPEYLLRAFMTMKLELLRREV